MILTLTPIVVIAIITLFTFFAVYNKQKKRKLSLVWLMSFIFETQTLLKNFQQHRGMANAYLKGDESFKSKLQELQVGIKSQLSVVNTLTLDSASVADIKIFLQIVKNSEQILQHVFSLKPEECFKQHSELIEKLLDLIEETATLTVLSSQYKESNVVIAAIIKEIPQLTEILGQSRGLGTGIAAQAKCSIENKIRLKFLHQRGMNVFTNSLKPLRDVNQDDLHSYKHSLESSFDKTSQFLELMNNELIETSNIVIAPNQYFESATAAIDKNFELLNNLLNLMKEKISEA